MVSGRKKKRKQETHLLRLHLEAAADGVERVRGVARRDGHGLRDPELGEETLEPLVVLEGVLLAGRVVETEVDTAVPGGAGRRAGRQNR